MSNVIHTESRYVTFELTASAFERTLAPSSRLAAVPRSRYRQATARPIGRRAANCRRVAQKGATDSSSSSLARFVNVHPSCRFRVHFRSARVLKSIPSIGYTTPTCWHRHRRASREGIQTRTYGLTNITEVRCQPHAHAHDHRCCRESELRII